MTYPGLVTTFVCCLAVSSGHLLAWQAASATGGGCGRSNGIVQYSRDGVRSPTFIEPGGNCQIELSPDDARLVVERRDLGAAIQPYDLWLADIASRTFTRWTTSSLNTRDPVWSPDSQSVLYRAGLFPAAPGQPRELRRMALGAATDAVVSTSSQIRFPDDWTRNGKFLLYHSDNPDTVGLLPIDGAKQPQVLLSSPGRRNNMRISPDGRWIAYGSNESGAWEVFVAAFPSFEGKKQISRGGAVQVRWRRDGKELFYLSNDSKMTAQAFDTASGEVGVSLPLFQTSANASSTVYVYSVTRQGDKFYVTEPETARLPGK